MWSREAEASAAYVSNQSGNTVRDDVRRRTLSRVRDLWPSNHSNTRKGPDVARDRRIAQRHCQISLPPSAHPGPVLIKEMPNKSKNPLVATTAGALAGGLEILTIWPMEMIKTNMQLGTMRTHYTGMLAGFRYHIREGGPLSLYRGMAPVLVGAIPKAGIRFGAFDYMKHQLADEDGNTTATRNFAAGIVAGAIEATLMTTPVSASRAFGGNM